MTVEAIKETIKDNSRLKEIHCPWCGETKLTIKGGKGKFKGNIGCWLICHHCLTCGRDSNLLITGDDFFPDRGFGAVPEDLNIKFG